MTKYYEAFRDVLEKQYGGKNDRSKCPHHNGNNPQAFVLFKSGVGWCHSVCSRGFGVPEMGIVLGVDVSDYNGITVDDLLQHFGFPRPDLVRTYFGLEDMKVKDKPCVAIPYFDSVENGGDHLGNHVRHTLTNQEGQKWSWGGRNTRGIGSVPYQIHRYNKRSDTAFIVEGESDVWTMHSCKFTNVLGFAGAGMFSADIHKDLVEGIDRLFVWAEHDGANDKMLRQISKANSRCFVLQHETYKDPSEWLQNEGLEAVQNGLLEQVNNPTTIEDYFQQKYLSERQVILDDPEVKKLLERGDIFESFRDDINRAGYVGDTDPAVAVFIAGNSRGTEEPINLYLSGASSVGKSFTIRMVMKYFPEEDTIEIGSATPGSFAHTDDDYQGKMMIVGEIDNLPTVEKDDPISSGIRELLARGRFIYSHTIKLQSGKFKVIKVDKGGNTALITTGVRAKLGAQLDTRFMSYEMSHDPKQNKVIAKHLIDKKLGKWTAPEPNHSPYVKLGGLLHYVSNMDIVTPFLQQIYNELPETYTLEHRFNRDFPKIATALEIVAKIRALGLQKLEPPITVTVDDYEVVYQVFGRCVISASGSVTEAHMRVIDAVKNEPKTQGQIAQEIGRAPSTVNHHVKRLVGLGYLEQVDRNTPYRYTQSGLTIPDQVVLPSPERLRYLLENESNFESGTKPNTDKAEVTFDDSTADSKDIPKRSRFKVGDGEWQYGDKKKDKKKVGDKNQ